MARQVGQSSVSKLPKIKDSYASGWTCGFYRPESPRFSPESTRNYGTRDKQKIPRDKIAIYFEMSRALTPETTSGEQVFEESTTWEGSQDINEILMGVLLRAFLLALSVGVLFLKSVFG